MKTLISTLLTLAAWISTPTFAADDCSKHLQAFQLWEDEIDGQIVLKSSLYPLVDWDPNSEYEGINLTADATKAVKKPILEIEFRATKNGKRKLESFRRMKPFEQDKTLSSFDDFKAKDFFTLKEAGQYTVRLKDDSALICSQTFKYNLGH